MSFKKAISTIFIMSALTLTISCGVKSDPYPPKDTMLPSIDDIYTQKLLEIEKDKEKKKK